MNSNSFFKKKTFKLNKIFPKIKLKKNFTVDGIRTLNSAKHNDITFFDSADYKSNAATTNAGACITTERLKNFIPNNVQTIVVKNVLFELSQILKKNLSFC